MQSEFWLPLQWSSLLAAQVMSEEAGLGRGEGMWMEFACGQRLSLTATLQRADVSERKKKKKPSTVHKSNCGMKDTESNSETT